MRERFSGSIVTVAIAAAAIGVANSVPVTRTWAQALPPYPPPLAGRVNRFTLPRKRGRVGWGWR